MGYSGKRLRNKDERNMSCLGTLLALFIAVMLWIGLCYGMYHLILIIG